MAALLFLAVCSYLFTLVASNPVAPVITPQAVLPRQQDGEGPPPDFIAWVPSTFNSTSTFYEPLSCGMAGGGSSWTFATTTVFESTFVQCCNTGRSSLSDCYSSFFTACSSSKTAYYSDTSIVCPSLCNADTIWRYSTPDAFGLHWVGCNTASQTTYWQEIPASALAESTQTSQSSSSSAVSARSTGSSSTGAATSAPALPTAVPAQSKEPSKAWIAGVVVGALALVAIAGLVFWLLRMRKQQQQQPYQQAPQTSQAYPQPPIPDGYASPRNPLSPHTATLSPMTAYQDQAHKGAFAPSTLDSRESQAWDNDRTKSWYQHNGAPGLQPPVHPALPEDTRSVANAVRVSNDLPELVNGSSRK